MLDHKLVRRSVFARSPLGLWISLSVEMMEMRYVPKSLHAQSTHALQRAETAAYLDFNSTSVSDLDGMSN